MLVTGVDAAILSAEMKYPIKKNIHNGAFGLKTIYWDEASEEMKNDPSIIWNHGPATLLYGSKWTTVRMTDQEKEELRAAVRNALKKRAAYILTNYGYNTLVDYTRVRKKEFERAKLKIDLSAIPSCLYNKTHQCNLECNFYNPAGCTYKGDFDENNL